MEIIVRENALAAAWMDDVFLLELNSAWSKVQSLLTPAITGLLDAYQDHGNDNNILLAENKTEKIITMDPCTWAL